MHRPSPPSSPSEASFSDATLLNVQSQILLKEYEMMRLETYHRLSFYFQICQIYTLALTAAYGYVIANKHWDILLLLPWISLALYMRAIWDQKVANFIDQYLREEVESKFHIILSHSVGPKFPALPRLKWKGWFEFYPAQFPTTPSFYKHSLYLIFGPISLFPSITYSLYNIFAVHLNWDNKMTEMTYLFSNNSIFIVMLGASVIFITMFIWISCNTYRISY